MKIWSKLKHVLGRRARVARLEEEMRHHIELLTEENVARGLDRAEARRQAHLAFGNVLATREESEDALGWPLLESCVQDAKQAARSLMRRPGFALALIAVLTLGIGVTTAVFTLVRAVLLDPLPVIRPEELHLVCAPDGQPFELSAPSVDRLSRAEPLVGRVAGYSSAAGAALRVGGAPAEPARLQFVSGDFFTALGVAALRGRLLGPADDAPGAPQPVAVVSHAFWQKRFEGAADVVGRSIDLNGESVTIVGVAPASFTGVSLGETAQLWVPLGLNGPLRCGPSAWTISNGPLPLEAWRQSDNAAWVSALVRLPAGMDHGPALLEAAWRPQLDAALAVITEQSVVQDFRQRVPQWVQSPQGHSLTRDEFRRVGLTLTLLVLAVVLVTAANSATLLLLRVLSRGRELGVRLALGAGKWRIARATLMEGLQLAVVGATGGLLVSLWLTPLLAAWLVPAAAGNLPGIDLKLIGTLAALAVALGLGIGAAPALLGARLSPQSILQQRVLGAGGSLRLGRGLIVAQLALSVMLISIAVAMALDLRRVLSAPPGYDRGAVVQAFFNLDAAGIPRERQDAVLESIRAAARELPQVRAVGFAASGALSGSRSRSGTFFRGEGINPPRENVQHESVDGGYFEAMGMTLLRGRAIAPGDRIDSPPVAVISEHLAREVFGAADPIGRRLGFGRDAGPADREIVGVVADARVNGVREPAPAMLYSVLAQWQARPACLVIRVEGDAQQARVLLQKKIAAAEPALMFIGWATLEERTQRWLRNDLATVRLTAGFGLLATLLAVIGVLGALGYLVASRSREIAVRLAVGADPARVWREILRDAVMLGVIGGAVGVVLAAGLPRVLGSWMMTGLRADWLAISLAATAGLLAATLGGLLPARRASKVDPLALLRSE